MHGTREEVTERGGNEEGCHGERDKGERKRQRGKESPRRHVRRRVTGKQPDRGRDGVKEHALGTRMPEKQNPGAREGEEEEGESVGQLASKEHDARRRRLRGKQKPPKMEGGARLVLKDKEKAWSRGHAIRRAGGIVFCAKCGSYAKERFGAGLRAKCSPPPSLGANAARARLQRLHLGRHPLQNKSKQKGSEVKEA